MKHLRKFNESTVEDIKSNLEYIFVDFSDRNIPVEIRHTQPRYQNTSGKTIYSIRLGDEYVDLDTICILPSDNKDEFLRVYDYMESEGYGFSSMSYDLRGRNIILRAFDTIGVGIDAFSNQLFSMSETCYLKLFFIKK